MAIILVQMVYKIKAFIIFISLNNLNTFLCYLTLKIFIFLNIFLFLN